MAHALQEREGQEKARKGPEPEGLAEAREGLSPQQARVIEATGNDQLKRALQSPDMAKPANAPVRSKILQVLVDREGREAVDRFLAEVERKRQPEDGEDGQKEDEPARDRAIKAVEARGLPRNLIPTATVGFELDQASGKFTLTLSGPMQFDVDGKTIKFDKEIRGVATAAGLEKVEGIKGKSGWFTASVQAIHAEGDELVIVTSLKTVRVPKASIPEF
jgi:hypothetical protein